MKMTIKSKKAKTAEKFKKRKAIRETISLRLNTEVLEALDSYVQDSMETYCDEDSKITRTSVIETLVIELLKEQKRLK